MLHKLYLVLWFSEPGFDILLLFVLFARRRASSFPFFTLCTAADTINYIILTFAARQSDSLFYRLLWPLHFAQVPISLLMTFELCRKVFCPTGTWASDVRKPLLHILSIGAMVALAIAALAHPSVGPHSSLLWRIQLFNSVLVGIFYVGMLVLSSFAGLPWKTHAARIVQALCAGNFVGLTLQIIDNSVSRPRLTQIYLPLLCLRMISDAIIMTFWLFALWRDEPAPQPLPDHMHKQIYTLQQQAEDGLIKIRSWKST